MFLYSSFQSEAAARSRLRLQQLYPIPQACTALLRRAWEPRTGLAGEGFLEPSKGSVHTVLLAFREGFCQLSPKRLPKCTWARQNPAEATGMWGCAAQPEAPRAPLSAGRRMQAPLLPGPPDRNHEPLMLVSCRGAAEEGRV